MSWMFTRHLTYMFVLRVKVKYKVNLTCINMRLPCASYIKRDEEGGTSRATFAAVSSIARVSCAPITGGNDIGARISIQVIHATSRTAKRIIARCLT